MRLSWLTASKFGNKTRRTDNLAGRAVFDHTYDYLGRLTGTTKTQNGTPQGTAYTLDKAGNRTSVTGAVDPGTYTLDLAVPEPADAAMHQYTQTPFDTRTYDKTGSLLTAENATYERAYTYDYQGRMVFAGDAIAGTAATYAYDPLGRRLSKSVQVGTGTPTSVRYAWDGWNLVQERDPSTNQLQASYVHGMGLDTPLQLERGTQAYYYHTDEQGTVWALTDASGQVVERYAYGDYGQPTLYDGTGQVITTSAVGNPLMYTGREWDAESGLYHYRMRYPDPRAGRFTTRDPLGLWGDPFNLGNPTGYVGNMPGALSDPLGLDSIHESGWRFWAYIGWEGFIAFSSLRLGNLCPQAHVLGPIVNTWHR